MLLILIVDLILLKIDLIALKTRRFKLHLLF
jgi:hypothetical protein